MESKICWTGLVIIATWLITMFYFKSQHFATVKENELLKTKLHTCDSCYKRNQPVYKVGLNQLMKGK